MQQPWPLYLAGRASLALAVGDDNKAYKSAYNDHIPEKAQVGS